MLPTLHLQVQGLSEMVLDIALSAYAREVNQQQPIAVGFQQHIAKPVEPEKLISIIVNLVLR